jgi:hypothetical protein
VKPVSSSYSIARHTNGTLQAVIAEKFFLPGKHRYDPAERTRERSSPLEPLEEPMPSRAVRMRRGE